MKRGQLADAWWRQAVHDLAAARSLHEDETWDVCALLCQQASEKAVKALWTDHHAGEAPPKTHWVAVLAEEMGAPREIGEALNRLVGDYVASRYPDATTVSPFEAYSAEIASDRLQKAELVMNWVYDQWEQ